MTAEHTADEIDTEEPTPDGLIESLTGRPLVRPPNLIFEEYCNRCDKKNSIRMRYDLPMRDGSFVDGARVTLICGYEDRERVWAVRAAHHADHPTKDKADVHVPGQAVAEVSARLDQDGWTYTQPTFSDEEPEEYHVEDRSVVRDAEIIWFSPIGDGQGGQPIVELDDDGMAAPKPTDPLPDWPDEENAWRREIIEELGDGGPAREVEGDPI
jgi:hypothetical protein